VVWVWTQPRRVAAGRGRCCCRAVRWTLLQIVIGIVDLGFCALAMYVLVRMSPILALSWSPSFSFRRRCSASRAIPRAGLACSTPPCWSAVADGQEDLLAGMLLFRVLYYIAPFIISVILLTFREVIVGARLKRLRQATAGSGEPKREAVYVRERGGFRRLTIRTRMGREPARWQLMISSSSSFFSPWPDRLRHSAIILIAAGMALAALVTFGELSPIRAVAVFACIAAAALVPWRLHNVSASREDVRGVNPVESAAVSAVVAGMPDPAVLLDRAGRVIHLNAAAAQLAPALRRNELAQFALRSPEIITALREAIATTETRRATYLDHVPVDRWMELIITPVPVPTLFGGADNAC